MRTPKWLKIVSFAELSTWVMQLYIALPVQAREVKVESQKEEARRRETTFDLEHPLILHV